MKVSDLDITVFENYMAMSRKASEAIVQNLKINPKQLLCIAAGHTSLGVLQELVDLYERREVDFSKASFVAMDEWTEMDEYTEGGCGWFLRKNFLEKVNYSEGNVFLWNGKAADYETECKRAQSFIREHSREGVIDFLILGSGMNGHLALNEPGSELCSRARCVKLDEMTSSVGQKYFNEDVSLKGGLTLGLADFEEAKRKILLISGEQKREILKKIRAAGKFINQVPATAMYSYVNSSVYCDIESISL